MNKLIINGDEIDLTLAEAVKLLEWLFKISRVDRKIELVKRTLSKKDK